MARLRWVEDEEAQGETAAAFEEVRRRRTRVPPVMRTMSLRPDVMVLVARMADTVHFSDGYLDRRTKERIATYVSSLNSCEYCATSHRVPRDDGRGPGPGAGHRARRRRRVGTARGRPGAARARRHGDHEPEPDHRRAGAAPPRPGLERRAAGGGADRRGALQLLQPHRRELRAGLVGLRADGRPASAVMDPLAGDVGLAHGSGLVDWAIRFAESLPVRAHQPRGTLEPCVHDRRRRRRADRSAGPRRRAGDDGLGVHRSDVVCRGAPAVPRGRRGAGRGGDGGHARRPLRIPRDRQRGARVPDADQAALRRRRAAHLLGRGVVRLRPGRREHGRRRGRPIRRPT